MVVRGILFSSLLPAVLSMRATGCAGPAPAPLPDPVAPPTYSSCGLLGNDCAALQGSAPTAVGVGDFDADGDLDVAAANFGSDTVIVGINDGSASFTVGAPIRIGDTPSGLATGDFDGDGDLDLAATSLASVIGPSINLLLNDGAAGFTRGADLATGNVCVHLAAGELNGDGQPDLICSIQGMDQLALLLSQPDHGYAPAAFLDTGDGPESSTTLDLDGDGDQDLAAINTGAATVSLFTNRGDGTFDLLTTLTTGPQPSAAAGADFDGDGDVDLAVASEGAFDDPDLDTVRLYRNDGGGLFTEVGDLPIGTNPRDIVIADFDADGRPDIATANYTIDHGAALVLNRGGFTFTEGVLLLAGQGSTALEVGDFDADGRLDLVVANLVSNDLSLLGDPGAVAEAAERGELP